MRRAITVGAMALLLLGMLETTAAAQRFESDIIARGLQNPWDVTYGPDRWLWVTEKTAGRVTRVRPSDGTKKTVVTIPDNLATPKAQDGLLGMAVDPRPIRGTRNRYIYVSYSYDIDRTSALDRRQRIRRYTYNARTQRAGSPVDLISGMPASNDHNSGRLVLGPDRRLYYTIGDQGHNQFANTCKAIRSQDLPTAAQVRAENWETYQGKILRLNTDGSVPADNPTIEGVKSHVYTYGHRNAQGIVFAPDGTLYSSEHGPKSDDELNIIRAGRNYGWPLVLGARDDNAYVYANWSASIGIECRAGNHNEFEIPSYVPQVKESDTTVRNFTGPIRTFFTVPSNYNFRDPKCPDENDGFVCYPTIGPSSIEIATARDGVPGWRNSLLIPSLKYGRLYRVKLSADGNSTTGRPIETWKSFNRYRDIAKTPDERTFYVSTDLGGLARSRAGTPTMEVDDPGVILRFRYRGR
jgi:PQQ-dependent dehydrogenase (s-GDH family)